MNAAVAAGTASDPFQARRVPVTPWYSSRAMNIASRSTLDIDLAAALVSGGDSRLRIDPLTGLNKYLCAAYPSPQIVCFSSCTASPISSAGWRAARETYARLRGDPQRPLQPAALQAEAIATAAALRSALGLDGLAEVLLTPSGTDATLFAIGLLAAETPGQVITSIMGEALETGTGVPLAAAGRHFSDFAAGGLTFVQPGTLLQGLPQSMHTLHIPLRSADGEVRPSPLVDADFVRAAAEVPGRPVVHLIETSKTGLRAPGYLPEGPDVIVDACQARVSYSRLRQYLQRGWPVLFTGSKFYGGPAFSGALLFPAARLAALDRRAVPFGLATYCHDVGSGQPAANLGTILRWQAALAEMQLFAAIDPAVAAERIKTLERRIADWIESTPGVAPAPVGPASDRTDGWPHGIRAFSVLDTGNPRRRLGLTELRDLYRELGLGGVLVGQPVGLGSAHGVLRIAIGARTLHDEALQANLQQLFTRIERRTTPRWRQ